MYKLRLLPLAIPVITSAKIINKYTHVLGTSSRKKKAGEKVIKEIRYWALQAIVGQRRVKVKVIIRQVGAGKVHFWSIMKLSKT